MIGFTMAERKRDAMDAHGALINHSIVPHHIIDKMLEASLENVLHALQQYIEAVETAEKEKA